MSGDIAVRLLGPVEVRAAGAWSAAGTPQRRLLLAVLALRAGQAVPVAELIDTVWEEEPPRSARASLHALVTRLRQALAGIGGAELERTGDGYRLLLTPGLVDVHRFRELASAGRDAADGQAAIAVLDEALALWRGPALADLPATGGVEVIRSRLASEHLSALTDRTGWLLRTGREREAAAGLPALLALHPLAERLTGMYMVALYRCGQRADALRVFRDIRARLDAELGVEPGPQLQRIHQRILASDAELATTELAATAGQRHTARAAARPAVQAAVAGTAGPPRPAVPRQLPAVTADFAGRAEELSSLSELSREATAASGPAPVWVISGTAGVGKTTLAVRWAHQAAAGFPDGQLYVNLRGFGPSASPATPGAVIRGFLQALGVPASRIPRSLDAQAALYRSMLAGRRMLVVLDNARDAGQVRPLLPGAGGCPVLITSRSQLTGLVAAEGARPLSLDVMPEADACELLARRLGAGRVAAEPAAAAELAQQCARLPLALAIAAARAKAQPGLLLSALAAELRSGHGRLDRLETGDAASSVREVFSWSVQQLSGPASRMFRLLGLHPGPAVSAAAAASLAGIPVAGSRRLLAELARAHLLTEPGPDRFTCHDLLRAYAAERAQAGRGGERDPALRRMLDYYLHTANVAARRLYPTRDPLPLGAVQPGAAPEQLRDRAHALAWFSAEHQVLLAAITLAAATGFDSYAWQLPAALTDYLNRQGHWHDLTAIQRTALAAARRGGDLPGQAHAHLGLGTAGLRLSDPGDARAHLERAIGLFRQLGDQARQARSYVTLGASFSRTGDYREARRHTSRALHLYRQLGHPIGQALALTNLGLLLSLLGDCQAAVSYCKRALGLHAEVGNPLGAAHAWDHLGYAHHCLGNTAEAISCYRRALGLLADLDRPEEAEVLTHLGDAYRQAGDRPAARTAWQGALAILEDLHDPDASQVSSRLGALAAPGLAGATVRALRRK